ncbi:putative nuclease HARBI1 [Eupeodes corollae]|uniref:putative nuclease HARBI1 n=1 Tax=Eupeodes corollae TaxID=290404 RepID=UPI0024903345|nr:putative nuclease HARBI1 [Eupeodes corollae]
MEEDLLGAAGYMTCVAAALSLYAAAKEKQETSNSKKREWVKTWRLKRIENSSFKFLYDELRLNDKDSYRRYLRMDEECFNEILKLVEPLILKETTQMRDPIDPRESLAMLLRFLATGESYRSLDFQTRLSHSFISKFIPRCCSAIYSSLKGRYLKFPRSFMEWEDVAEGYSRRWSFPLCLGAMDGKHIGFRASKTDGALYYNYKGFNSIILLAMCDARYKFTFIDVGCNGRLSDGGVLNRSDLCTILSNPSRYFPPDAVIGRERKLPYSIIGDDAFPLQKHILKPYSYTSTEKQKKTFNFRLSHARQCIEHSFGMLANRFRVLQTTIHLRPEKVKLVVQACCVLHNFLIENCGSYEVPQRPPRGYTLTEDNEISDQRRPTQVASDIRDEFAKYFTEEGQLPWQDLYI